MVYMFSTRPLQQALITSRSSLHMGGGRNQAEIGLSKRQMFKQLKGKLNNEAKASGFFEVGDGPAVK